ncbi:MAG: glycosyltransferase family 4 protein [Solirubrobacteraceae bacterium]
MARPRVLLATTDFPPMGGGIQLLLARLVEHADWETSVVCFGSADAGPVDRELAADVVRVPRLANHQLSVIKLAEQTLRESRRRPFDAVVCGHLVLGPAALLAARCSGRAAVQYLYAKELGTRPRIVRSVLPRMDASIAISDYTHELALVGGAPASRVHVITPGSDAPDVAYDRPAAKREPVVVTVARLEDRYKGFDVLLRAFPLVRAQVPDARWIVVGKGRLRPELEATAHEWGIGEHVEFTGAVDDATRDGILQRAAVFAMPSRVPAGHRGGEGFGIVYLEAGAAGLPVVAGAEGGATSAVVDGVTGLLTDPRDHVAVAERIVRLLRDPELARRLGAAGREHQRSMTWERMAREVDVVVHGAMDRRRR